MKILIITDIHYGEDTIYPQLHKEDYVSSFGSQFESFLPKINSLIARHDLVINLGDLISETDTESDLIQYKKAVEFFGKEKPIKHVLGNHELNTLSRDQLAELIGEKNSYYSFDLGGYHHIVLDSFRNSKKEPCRIKEEQLEWLKEDLDNTNLLTIIYCHYPLDNQSVDNNYYFKNRPDRAFIENKEEVRSVFELSGKVLAVFNGHLHFFNEESINGIKYVTVPAFSENNGMHESNAECLSVNLEGNKIIFEVKKIN